MSHATPWDRLAASPNPDDRAVLALAQLFARQQPAVEAIIAETVHTGQHPRETARQLEYGTSALPLTPIDAEHVQQVRIELERGEWASVLARPLRDKRFDRSLRREAPLRPEQIDRMVDAYQRKLIADRLHCYAHFAAISAVQVHTSDSWHRAVQEGVVPRAEVRRYWVVTRDERGCARCRDMQTRHPTGVGLDEPFTGPDGQPIMWPPICVRCRCLVAIRRERAGVRPAPAPGTQVFTEWHTLRGPSKR
jgi:hypothetical protein